ncbi:HNH endonuclease family protein [Paenarthrobacter nicotinovorans]|uniref:HNH endonuclease family protein n=1 Tax=Paenarthrobacter nicotinovorans TaxID=29320 RepID=UPI0037CAE5AF
MTAGTLTDPYTGRDIEFRRGPKSDAVEIDHIVALADAWQKGAQEWDADKRRSFANDPENLLAADGPANSQKGAGDLATWLPPNTAFRCTYAANTVHIKSKYGLWMTAGEQATAHQILSNCTQPGRNTYEHQD